MASPSQFLTQHIESFVDSSGSSTRQAAGLEGVVSLLKSGKLTFLSLVREMQMYLTATDYVLRARGILLLGEALSRLSTEPLDDATVHTLVVFFKERLADWRALRGALVGCLALVRRKTSSVISLSDAKDVAESYLQNLQVQSLAQHDRKLCFELLECLLENHSEALASLGEHLIYGVCESIDGEKDPQCLVLTFHIVETLVQLFPDPSGPISSFSNDLFSVLECYFPIHFTHETSEAIEVTRDELSRALMLAFSSTSLFEPYAIPLLLEKLSSSLPTAKVDSLKFLSHCSLKYGAERMAKHAGIIWSSLKDALSTSVKEMSLSISSESLGGFHCKDNEITSEALSLLEKVIIQNTDLYLNLIVGDEDINMIINTSSTYESCNEIPSQSKQKLQVVGCILYVSAKASIASCNRLFESFFPCLMETLGNSIEDGVVSRRPPYGPLFLCVELLVACRDLLTGVEDLMSLCSSTSEKWCCFLQHFSAVLSNICSYNLSSSGNEPANNVDIYLGVKGLQTLAMFPGGSSLIPQSMYENILSALILHIVDDFEKTFLWEQSLTALMHIGSSSHACIYSQKMKSFVNIVVEKVVLVVSSGDFVLPFPLKLEALSNIGSSGVTYMRKIVQGLEEVIHAELSELYAHGNLKSSKILLQLSECFCEKLLPWIQKNGGFEESLLQFVLDMWNQIENCENFAVGPHEKELLDATMKVMKLSVACCSVESQNIIASKCYHVVLESTSLPLEVSLSAFPVKLKALDLTQEMDRSITKDEWIHSLFASVIIALHPETIIPNVRVVLHLFTSLFLKGYVAAAQALGSLVNKLDLKSKGKELSDNCTLEEALDIIFGSNSRTNGDNFDLTSICLGAQKSEVLQTRAIVGCAWIGKGILMRGHERVKDMTMVFLECLLSNGRKILPTEKASLYDSGEHASRLPVMKCAADAFQILMSDSELCLNRQFHAIVRPLYKQRFFSTVVPILLSLIVKSDLLLVRSMLHRAFAHIISDSPLTVILNDAKKLIPLIMDALSLSTEDVLDNDTIYNLLLVLSGILTHKNGHEAVVENARVIINGLIPLIGYPHMMLIRETAIQCVDAMSNLPHTRIYPMRIQVLQATSKALDDPKRAVRQVAVKCRQEWASIASRGPHF